MRRTDRHALARRGGFTLVEMLVAAAVSIVLMAILTEAFKRGIDMFRTLRAQGQLQERLRFVSTGLRDDMASFHFETAALSTDNYYLSGMDLNTVTPPTDGFFRIYQGPDPLNPTGVNNPGGEPCVFEGTDGDGILYTRATTHILHFTVFRRETSPTVKFPVDPSYLFRTREPSTGSGPYPSVAPNDFPRAYVDPPDFRENGIFASRWAEVAYFLVPNGRSANGTPLFNLHRRIKLLLPKPGGFGQIPIVTPKVDGVPGYLENPDVSTRTQLSAPVGRFYNRTGSVTQPRNRLGMEPAADANDPNVAGFITPGIPAAGPPVHGGPTPGTTYPTLAAQLPLGLNDPRAGDDVLLSDVLSFEVKATWETANPLLDAAPRTTMNIPALGGAYPNPDYPFDYVPLSNRNLALSMRGIRVFDTWSDSIGSPYAGQWDQVGAAPPDATAARIPLRIRVKAVLVRLRVWDAKAEQTRQLTIIMDT